MSKINIKNRGEGGYTVLELLFYISFFTVLSIVVINSMITMTRAFRETTLQAEFLQSGSMMERMSREIRQAYDIASLSANDLKLNTKDDAGISRTVEFSLSDSNIEFRENDILTGNLNSLNIAVTSLTFTQITTTKGKAVKIFLTIKSNNDALSRDQDFYDTVVLRGSY